MANRVKTTADLAVKERSAMHRWTLHRVHPVEAGIFRYWGCDCVALQTRFTAMGERVSRRTRFRMGGDGHG